MEPSPWEQGFSESVAPQMIELKSQIFSELFKGGKVPSVKFGSFVKILSKVLNDSKSLYIENEINGPFDKPMVRMLIQALGIGKGSDEIKPDHIDHLFLWVDKGGKKDFIGYIYDLMSKDWFFWIY